MEALVGLLKLLGDETRLRLLRLLAEEASLNVGELVRLLGLAQSSVSRQLGELRKAGLVRERRDAGFSYYELAPAAAEAPLELLLREVRSAPDTVGDLARLAELRRERSERQVPADRFLEPGRSWAAWARGLSLLIPPLDVADFGCGDGALTVEIAAWARHVVGIDRNPAALERARRRVARLGLENVKLVEEDLARTSLRAASCDLVLISHALHYAQDPAAIVAEARRVLRVPGRLLVFELLSHGEAWVEEKLGHTRLGFSSDELTGCLSGAGFDDVSGEVSAIKARREPFRIIITTGVLK